MSSQEKTIAIQGQPVTIYADQPVRVACLEHLERELDDYVDRHEAAPDTFKREDVDDPALPDTCAVCGAPGQVVLLRVKGK